MLGIKGRYLDTELEFATFHKSVEKTNGVVATNLKMDHMRKGRVYGIYKGKKLIGGWIEDSYPFDRSLNNIPAEKREEVLSKGGLTYYNTVFITSLHLQNEHNSLLTSLVITWKFTKAAFYNSKKNIAGPCFEPKLFGKYESLGAIALERKESTFRPGKEEILFYIKKGYHLKKFMTGVAWIMRKKAKKYFLRSIPKVTGTIKNVEANPASNINKAS